MRVETIKPAQCRPGDVIALKAEYDRTPDDVYIWTTVLSVSEPDPWGGVKLTTTHGAAHGLEERVHGDTALVRRKDGVR